MEKKWGNEHFEEYYEKVRRAVRETEGLVAEYDGELIEPFYCLASAGKTRELAAYPYLSSVESPGDLETEGFLYVRTFTESEFADRIGRIGGPQPAADGIAEKIQIIERDSKLIWHCPQCGNEDQDKMNVARRTCGYIGTQFWNQGRTAEIKDRVLHL